MRVVASKARCGARVGRAVWRCVFRSAAVGVGCAAMLLMSGCHHAHRPLLQVRLQMDGLPGPEAGGFYEAKHEGLYEDAGLDVTLAPSGANTDAAPQVASGAAQFGLASSAQVLVDDARGMQLVAVAAYMQQDPQAVMVHADSPVLTFADLSGHTIAAAPDSVWIDYLTHRYGLKDVRVVPQTPAWFAQFVHDPDAVEQVAMTAGPYLAEQAGADVRTLLVSGTGLHPYRVIFTSRAFLAAHPQAVAAFVRASLQGWKDYLDDPAAANREMEALNPQLTPGLAAYSAKMLRTDRFVNGDGTPQSFLGHMEPQRWAVLEHQLELVHVLTNPKDPATAYTLQMSP